MRVEPEEGAKVLLKMFFQCHDLWLTRESLGLGTSVQKLEKGFIIFF